MHQDAVRYKTERDFERQRTQHHIRRGRELERMLAELIASAQHKPQCKCGTAKALRDMAAELEASDRARR